MHHVNHHGRGPGLAAPERAELIPETRTPADGAGAAGGQRKESKGDSAAAAPNLQTVQADAARRELATLKAQAARHGVRVFKSAAGYTVARWKFARDVADIDAAVALLQRMECSR